MSAITSTKFIGSQNFEEHIEKSLNHFTDKRDMICQEIIKIRDDSKRLLDDMFSGLIERLQVDANQVDELLDERVREVKKYMSSLKEIEAFMEKMKSVLGFTNAIETNGNGGGFSPRSSFLA